MARYTTKKRRTVPPPRKSLGAARPPREPAKRKQWTEEQMVAAMEAVANGTAPSINRAAKDHGIPPTTLKDRISGRVVHGRKPGPLPYLDKDDEYKLETFLIDSCRVGYGKTRRQVKAIVETVASQKGVLRGSCISDGWWRRFRERHPNLSLRHGDATGFSRMNAMTRENIEHYFGLLKKCMEEHNLFDHPERIYNMDESGIPLDPKPPKVVSPKGQKKIRYRCSGQKSQITVIGCCSATGQAIPPFVIFDAKQLNLQWCKGEVPGTRYGLSDSGWTNKELFSGWLEGHFLSNAVAGRPLLLLVDGHSSHYDPDTIQFALEHDIVIFCIPPHTTHEAQPLDVSFFKPLKMHWGDVCHQFYQSSPGKVITKFNFSELFSKAWLKTCIPTTICSGFKKAGIVPFNPEILLSRVVDSPVNSNAGTASKETPDSGDSSCTDPVSGKDDSSNFSEEQTRLFTTRLDEGYDLYDEDYQRWLQKFHPDHAHSIEDFFPDAQAETPINFDQPPTSPDQPPDTPNLPLTSPDQPPDTPNLPPTSPDQPPDTPILPPTSPDQPSDVPNLPPTSPDQPPVSSNLPLIFPEPEQPPVTTNQLCTSQMPQTRAPLASIQNTVCTPNRLSHSKVVQGKPCNDVSLLDKLLEPVAELNSARRKTGCAKVLTSAECLRQLEEKQRKKELEAEEKARRKREREERKKEKELMQKKKKEEQLEKKRKKEEAKALKKKSATSTRSCRRAKNLVLGSKVASATSPPATRSGSQVPGTSDNVLNDEGGSESEDCVCAFCYGMFGEDDEEWVKCACDRWLHERCMEDLYVDANGEEHFCPFCINRR